MLREAMEPQRLSLMTADNPIALRARGGSPGSDVNQGSRLPRDTAGGVPDGDFAVLLYTVSRTNTDSSGHSETSSSGKKSGSAGIGAW